MLTTVLARYKNIKTPVKKAIAAQFCLQAVNTAYFLLLNYYMVQEGYTDYEAAEVFSYRFFAVFFLAFPVGLFIKGRPLKPFLYAAVLLVPISSLLIIWSIENHWEYLVFLSTMTWGVGYMCIQITILPFILLNARPENHSEAFSLSFLSFSGMLCLVGISNFIFNNLAPTVFTEKNMLLLISALSLLGLYFVHSIDIKENISHKIPLRRVFSGYDWKTIFRAIIPSFIIAVGAGFTIPVINLFFLKVHDMESDIFSIVGSLTFFLVGVVMLFMPYIRRSFGYGIAITLFQSLSVFALFVLATTEYYKDWQYALYIAILFYVIRQPLMSAAAPMTSELMMYFVGKRNQEVVAALNASLWSGSWFVSMKLFQWMRIMQYRYVTIFLITVGLYAIGVVWYAALIRAYYRRKALLKKS